MVDDDASPGENGAGSGDVVEVSVAELVSQLRADSVATTDEATAVAAAISAHLTDRQRVAAEAPFATEDRSPNISLSFASGPAERSVRGSPGSFVESPGDLQVGPAGPGIRLVGHHWHASVLGVRDGVVLGNVPEQVRAQERGQFRRWGCLPGTGFREHDARDAGLDALGQVYSLAGVTHWRPRESWSW
jgi:hypothetical protein